MSVYCESCTRRSSRVVVLPPGQSRCPSCGREDQRRCVACNELIVVGLDYCARCGQTFAVAPREEPPIVDVDVVPVLPPIEARGLAVPVVPVVAERYQAGRHGIRAEVVVPKGDVVILNELGSLVSVLHVVADRLNHLTGHADHTRKLIRDMRVLAADAQEEIELRRGPG